MENAQNGKTSAALFDRRRLSRIADGLVIAVAISLPWSTSATSILTALWLAALLPTFTAQDIRQGVAKAAGWLPVLLFALAAAGMLWADAEPVERFKALVSFLKLLAIPLLFVQFRRSDRTPCVFGAYLAACVVLLVVSWAIFVWPALWWPRDFYGVPVKNGATQSEEFALCIAGLLFLAIEYFDRRRWLWLSGLLALVFAMCANMVYVATGRTALVILPVLVAILAARRLSRRGMALLTAGSIVLVGAAWASSPYLRTRTIQLWTDYQHYEATDERNSSGERIEFWKKSIEFVARAPILGNGTGSITPLFKAAAVGDTGAASTATTNPHNQTFAVAIQVGLVGAAILWAMWIAHLLLFRGTGLAEWVGLAVVVQNIIGSLFNSHLSDFAQGWLYVFGVGVAGGIALGRQTPSEQRSAAKIKQP